MKPKKNEEVKARVDAPTKSELLRYAIGRQLDVSDVLRQAVREFLERNASVNQAQGV